MPVKGAYPPAAGRASSGLVAFDMPIRAAVARSMWAKVAEMSTLVLMATVVPRALGPHDYGRFAVPLTIVTLGSLAMTLGGPTLLARFVPSVPEAERTALARAIGGRLARGRAAQLVVVVVAAAAAVAWAPSRFPPLDTTLIVAALALSVGASVALQLPLGLGRTGPWTARYAVQNGVLIVAVLVLHPAVGTIGGPVAILVSTAAVAALAAVVTVPLLRAKVDPVPVPSGAIRFGALHAAGAALGQLAQRGGVVAVALLGGASAQTGYAALAVGVSLGATYAVLQAFTVSLPHLSSADWRVDAGEREAVLRRLAGGLLAFIVPAAVTGALLLEALVPAVFGADYTAAASAFGPALASVVLAPLGSLLVQVAALRLRPEVALASGAAGAGAFVAVALTAVPRWGAVGATAAALAAAAAGSLVAMQQLPGAAGARLAAGSFAGAALVLALAAA